MTTDVEKMPNGHINRLIFDDLIRPMHKYVRIGFYCEHIDHAIIALDCITLPTRKIRWYTYANRGWQTSICGLIYLPQWRLDEMGDVRAPSPWDWQGEGGMDDIWTQQEDESWALAISRAVAWAIGEEPDIAAKLAELAADNAADMEDSNARHPR